MDHRGAVLVGLGDEKQGMPELGWAAHEAQLRNAPLHILRAYHLVQNALPWDSYTDRVIAGELRASAERHLRAATAYVARDWPGVSVRPAFVDAPPTDALVEASADALLTVLGTRQLGVLGATFLGSVSTVVAALGRGPVVFVGKPAGLAPERPEVVVGADGSEFTEDVLGFAFEHASRRERSLRAIYCWPRDPLATSKWRAPQPVPQLADRWLAEALAGWQEKYPDVVVHRGVVRDHPIDGLVQASMGQDLLVVGSHSRHARIGALLGSVSQGVLHRATCPVAVIHPRKEFAS